MLEITMISTGDEVLLGDITDTNAAWLSRFLFQHGFTMTRRITVGDHHERLAKDIEAASLNSDIVIVNGGLGPTCDDLTAAAAAMAADVGLVQSDLWIAEMKAKYRALHCDMPLANLKQAMLPQGATLIDNPVGTACGFSMTLNRAWLCFTPGVPSEFRTMIEHQILPYLQDHYPHIHALHCHRCFTYGLSESGISDAFKALVLPQGYSLGYRSSLPFIEVKLFAPQQHDETAMLLAQIEALLGENVVGKDAPLLDTLALLITQTSQRITLVEYATGGYVVNQLHQHSVLSEHIATASVVSAPSHPDDIEWVQTRLLETQEHPQSDIALVSGADHEGIFTVGIRVNKTIRIQQLQCKRRYAHHEQRCVIATVLLDMLRRQLQSLPVFGDYESFDRLFQLSSL